MEHSSRFTLSRCQIRRIRAFTLIELLAVMAIILVLAGLILGTASHAQYKSSLSRATTEIQGLNASIENYKVDNGVYPENGDTDKVNPQRDFDPTVGDLYKKASAYLYQELSGLHIPVGGTSTNTKGYFTFQPNQLGIMTGAPGGVTAPTPTSPYMYITDPFGFSYGYSTAYLNAVSTASASTTPAATPAPGNGYNPTFDLWSTAGYSPTSGKGTPTSGPSASPNAIYSNLWIKNW